MLTYRRPNGYVFTFDFKTNEVIAKQNGNTLDKKVLNSIDEFNHYVRVFVYHHKLLNKDKTLV